MDNAPRLVREFSFNGSPSVGGRGGLEVYDYYDFESVDIFDQVLLAQGEGVSLMFRPHSERIFVDLRPEGH